MSSCWDEISSRQKRANSKIHFTIDRDDFIPGWNFTCKHPLKLVKYFKDGIVSNGFLFLQKTHSTVNDEIKWKDDFESFPRMVNFPVFWFVSQAPKNFILGLCYHTMMAENFILTDLHYSNTVAGQVKTLSNLTEMLTKLHFTNTAQKLKFSIKDFFSKCDQIRSFLRIWSHLLRKS